MLGEEHSTTVIFADNLGTFLQRQGKDQETLDLLAPIEPAARRALTGGNGWRLASILTTLGLARVGLGYDAERFTHAEAIHLLLAIDRISGKVVMSVDVNGETSFNPNPEIAVGQDGGLSIEVSNAAECRSIKRLGVRGVSANASRLTVVTSEGTLNIDVGLAPPTTSQPALLSPEPPSRPRAATP